MRISLLNGSKSLMYALVYFLFDTLTRVLVPYDECICINCVARSAFLYVSYVYDFCTLHLLRVEVYTCQETCSVCSY